MKKIQYVVLLLSTVLLIGCESTESNEKKNSLAYKLEVSTDKVFPLDDETAFDGIKGKYVEIDNKGYYTFFNRENHSLYFYDYQTSELEHVTKMDKQGPNAVDIPYNYLDFRVQDLDNIFINVWGFLYHINKAGEVLNKYNLEDVGFNNPTMSLDETTVFKNNKMYMEIDTSVPTKGGTNFLRAAFDFKTGKINERYIDEREVMPEYEAKRDRLEEMAKSGGVVEMDIDFVRDEQQLVAATAIGDSLYFFEDFQLADIYYAGDPDIVTANLDSWFSKTKLETSKGRIVGFRSNPVQPAFYTDLFISSDKKTIYRILIHGTKGVIPEGGKNEIPKVFGASLIIFDVDTKTSTSLELPIEALEITYYSRDTFVTPDGILFPVKDVESESEKVYRTLKISKLD